MSRRQSIRQLKKMIEPLLLDDAFEKLPDSLDTFQKKQVINPLISFFCSKNTLLKWRAVSAVGIVVSRMAKQSMEDARVVMRRLMWTLNDESGGIGWGAPEAMGEIMALSEDIALEYHRILISYADENGNYLEHIPLQKGLLWGIGRLSEVRPELLGPAAAHTRHYLYSDDPVDRGLSAIISGNLKDPAAKERLHQLTLDKSIINIYRNGHIIGISISELASRALAG